MTTCCSEKTASSPPKQAVCPRNGRAYPGVKRRTVLHQLRKPWARDLADQGYYFCDDPDCDVVYFGEDQSMLLRHDIRNHIGQKSRDTERTICYCFDVDFTDLETAEMKINARQFVIEQTRNASCDCEIRNPSGKCCLADFP